MIGEALADEQSFASFVTARSAQLLRTAYLLTQDHALAEDLLQTALARAWLAWSRVDGDPEPYVRRILSNLYATWWRRKWNRETPTEQMPERYEQSTAEQAVDERADLWNSLGRLPKQQRAVVVLRFYEDLSVQETADILGCSAGTVKSQTSKALAKLRVDDALRTSAGPIEKEA